MQEILRDKMYVGATIILVIMVFFIGAASKDINYNQSVKETTSISM